MKHTRTAVSIRQTPTPAGSGVLYEAKDAGGRVSASFQGMSLAQVVTFLEAAGDTVRLG